MSEWIPTIPVGRWQPIATAPEHVREVARITHMTPGRFRGNFYVGPDGTLFVLWCGGDVGSTADQWVQLPNCPI